MSEIVLRPAVHSDAAAIRRMIHHEHLNPFSLDWNRFIVAGDEKGSVFACAQVKLHRDGTRELASLVVLPQYRGQGIARRLIEAIIKREMGPLYLTCRSGLIPLYERFGFKSLSRPDLPPYFRRLLWVFHLFQRIVHVPENLAIMRRDTNNAPGV